MQKEKETSRSQDCERTFITDRGCSLVFVPAENAKEYGDEQVLDLYKGVYYFADLLNVRPPHITPIQEVHSEKPITEVSPELAHTFFQADFPAQLDRDFICVNGNIHPVILRLILAREMRHIWQKQYHPKKFNFEQSGLTESLWSSAEIDADAYVIACMHHYITSVNVPMQNVAAVLCDDVMATDPAAYKARLKAAKRLNIQMYLQDFQRKIKSFFRERRV